jgi:hypothetical protein
MKSVLIIIIVLMVAFLAFQSFVNKSVQDTEEQPYKVLKKEGEFEIRHYPSVVMATVKMPPANYGQTSSGGFRRLAGYIFGGNQRKQKIAMTSPVQMEFGNDASSMSFMMPSEYSMQDLPKPDDSGIDIHPSQEEYVAAVSFSGFASNDKIKAHEEMLAKFIKDRNLVVKGAFRVLGYDPPYKMTDRRNEVIVPIEYKN